VQRDVCRGQTNMQQDGQEVPHEQQSEMQLRQGMQLLACNDFIF
jgi:hypothetical protein